jgi:hypothetical protein
VQFCWQVPLPDTMVELTQVYPGVADPANAAVGEAAAVVEGEVVDDTAGEGAAEMSAEPAGEDEPAMEGNEAEQEGGNAGPADANSNEEK